MSVNLGDHIAPTSDQLDAVDLLDGERVFTITGVRAGSAEQPIQIDLAEFPRPWRPGKSMRRVLVACWGGDGATYAGRRIALYCDPEVVFGGIKVGGTRIRALSHIDGPITVPLIIKRGKSASVTIQPLPDAPPPAPAEPTAEQIAACTRLDELRTMWQTAGPEVRALITARKDELTGGEQ